MAEMEEHVGAITTYGADVECELTKVVAWAAELREHMRKSEVTYQQDETMFFRLQVAIGENDRKIQELERCTKGYTLSDVYARHAQQGFDVGRRIEFTSNVVAGYRLRVDEESKGIEAFNDVDGLTAAVKVLKSHQNKVQDSARAQFQSITESNKAAHEVYSDIEEACRVKYIEYLRPKQLAYYFAGMIASACPCKAKPNPEYNFPEDSILHPTHIAKEIGTMAANEKFKSLMCLLYRADRQLSGNGFDLSFTGPYTAAF
ncbi:hypothetical protein P280DRAFT_96137 [Massarina eburnea CBS 473.64]|uniref:Uncharacterized protein n=1 Tax=Massarina eburnea CBS 473.64 TaxID=1395130 RepID=A0A6A6RQ89_9PLEO|nr:hypothetical protein P280DRAFT_96137 [Massarina eburnea CBS 473.64]